MEFNIYLIGGVVFILGIIILHKFYFLRNPEREITKSKGILSPADGRVIRIKKFNQGKIKYLKGIGQVDIELDDIAKEGYLISIFMSPFDVHYNRSPISGKITKQKYRKGKFNMAFRISSFIKNEQNEITIKGKHKIKLVQVAGFLARKIKSYVKTGQEVKKGENIGLIKLGSQATLVIPKELKPKVKKGQRVKGGVTIIAEESNNKTNKS